MKLAKRIAMILASVLTALGLIMMIAGMFMLDWDYYRLDLDGEYVEMCIRDSFNPGPV